MLVNVRSQTGPEGLPERPSVSKMKDLIFKMLQEILAREGFQLKKSDDSFQKKIPGGKQILGVPLWNYSPEYQFSLNVLIRLDAVEEIFHQFAGIEPKYRSMSFTTNTPLERFTGKDQDRFSVRTGADVESIGTRLSSLIHDKVIPFLDQYSNIDSLATEMNSESQTIDKSHEPSHGMHSIILAHLARNPNFDRLAELHQKNMPLAYLQRFDSLVEYLKTRCDLTVGQN